MLAKYFHFGIEPLVAYLFARENEAKNLKMILAGKKNGFGLDDIRPYLRDSYV